MQTDQSPTPWEVSDSHAEALVRVIESAVEVRRRYQFFVWTQSNFQSLLPHTLAICGAYERSRKQVQLEAFNSISVAPSIMGFLTDGQSAFMQGVLGAWSDNRGKPLTVKVDAFGGRNTSPARDALQEAGFTELLVHGVSRPQRTSEIESFFILTSPRQNVTEQHRTYIELLLPHLHRTYLRVQYHEREINDKVAPPAQQPGYSRATITAREEQILSWVREGMSNQQIGEKLSISPLTVKNHVQKILRKLGATNRAQAVARAMSMNLLGSSSNEG